MQWLNKVDDALDWVLGPAQSTVEDGNGNGGSSGNADDEIARAAVAAVSDVAKNAIRDVVDGPTSLLSAQQSLGSTSAQYKGINNEGAVDNSVAGEVGHKNDNSAATNHSKHISPRPPVPPPPPPPERKNTATPPPAKRMTKSSPLICPTTPLVAMSGEFLVLGDSHNVQNTKEYDVDVSSNCQPPDDDMFTKGKSGDETASITNDREDYNALIGKDADKEIIQQRQKTQSDAKQSSQVQLSEGFISKDEKVHEGRHRVYSAERTTPLLSRMQDLAKASPAPTKVTIRERSSADDSSEAGEMNEEKSSLADKIKVIPPPPPLPGYKEENEKQTIATQQKTERQVPPSPSNFIIELPMHQQQDQETSPIKMARMLPPPPVPPDLQSNWGATTPNPAIKPPAQPRINAPRSATRGATSRPTPGVIRRRIREPSLSPPESPTQSVTNVDNENVAASSETTKKDLPIPPPPFLPSSVTVDKSDEDKRIGLGSGEVLPTVDKVIGSKVSIVPPPPPSKPPHPNITKANADRAVSDLSSDDFEDNAPRGSSAKGDKIKAQHMSFDPPSPVREEITPTTQSMATAAPSPPHEHVTPVTHNLKSTLLSGLTYDDDRIEVKPKENIDGAIAKSSPNEISNQDGESTSNEIPVTDAIADWFRRMGSTDGGGVSKDTKTDAKTDKDEVEREDIKDDLKDDKPLSDDDSFHSQLSNDSELTESNQTDDFAVPAPSLSQIQDVNNQPWDPSLNCYGFFHVRLLRAQRLPCASGSSINASMSLKPWKGRVVIPTFITADGPEGAAVCLRWDKPLQQKQRRRLGSKDGSKDGESRDADPCSHSMVHAYNNEDTPIPTIVLELTITSMGGVFDRFLCSVSIPCQDLMRNPRSWSHKWYPASLTQGTDQPNDDDDIETAPLILLETCFEPKTMKATVSTLSKSMSIPQEKETVDETDPLEMSGDSDTLGSIPQIIRPNDRRGGVLDDESSTLTTPATIQRNTIVAKSHLLRVRSFWTPAWCAVCSKSLITGWMQGKSFECEACHIFCCRDCQLQVDARISCGSDLATNAVKEAQQYQVPSFSQIMTTLAPQLDTGQEKKEPGGSGMNEDLSLQPSERRSSLSRLQSEGQAIEGIGIMNIRVVRACLFDKTFPSEADPEAIFQSDYNLRNGDHYVRISWLGSKESKRTKTVLQTSKPLFDSEEMIFDVKHYGMEYKLEVIDANTDNAIGSCLLSAQGLLQWQRDELLAKKDRLFLSLLHLKRYSEPRRIKLELRTGVKDGFGLNFYNSSKVAEGPNKQCPGEISGWLELDVHLEEDRQLFYSASPRRCPKRAEEDFDIALIQLHIQRITAIIESMKKLVSSYMYVVSWEDQKLTGTSLFIFVVLTLRFNLEYLGSLPVGCLVLYMTYLAYLRINGHFKDRWTLKEKEALIMSETKIEKNQSIFRPLGLLHVGELQGKNLRSRELGLPGSFYAAIMYDPLRYADDKMKASLKKIDSSSGCTHEVGNTTSPGITSHPVWTQMQESTELMRLKHLLPDDRIWGQKEEMDTSLSYPILQPIIDRSFVNVDMPEDGQGVSLMPWEQSCGAVVIQVRFSDVLGTFQMFDNVLGEVVIPLAKLAGSGRTVEGWFRLLAVGTTDTVPGEEAAADDSAVKSEVVSEDSESEDEDESTPAVTAFPELYVSIKFSPNALNRSTCLIDDIESFKVICEELSRTASMAQRNSIGVIGSSLNTINTVRTLGGTLQNQMSFFLDMIERVRNAFNFSNPRITIFILLGLSLLWIVLALIPTRIVILLGGLGQFGATYYIKFMARPKKKTAHKEVTTGEPSSTDRGNPLENLFLSIPTDEDLRRTYFWEARRLGEKEREKFAITKRQARLDKLWKAKWHGALKLKEKKAEHNQPPTPTSSRTWSWEPAFGLIEGHRFIWWRSERHFDTGEAPLGQIFFAGHSGLAGLSPLDLRELSKEEIPKVVSIFGRGSQGQQKVTLLASSSELKDSLENAVLDASMGKGAKVD